MGDPIDRDEAIKAVRRSEALFRAYGYRYAVDALMELPSVDAIDRQTLIETIKHYMQYPDGMSRLLEVYGGNDRENDIKRDM